jgi:hypothetical protein
MSKIIRIEKCEGFCKHIITKSIFYGGSPINNCDNHAYCEMAHWFINSDYWISKAFRERCPYKTLKEEL